MSANQLLTAILQVEPLAWLDYRSTPKGIEWSCYREGASATEWHESCERALAAYAAELQAAVEEQQRKSDEAADILSEALARSAVDAQM